MATRTLRAQVSRTTGTYTDTHRLTQQLANRDYLVQLIVTFPSGPGSVRLRFYDSADGGNTYRLIHPYSAMSQGVPDPADGPPLGVETHNQTVRLDAVGRDLRIIQDVTGNVTVALVAETIEAAV